MSSQPSKTTPSKGFTCDCEDPSSIHTIMHKTICWKVPKCDKCEIRTDNCPCDCTYVAESGYYHGYYNSDDGCW